MKKLLLTITIIITMLLAMGCPSPNNGVPSPSTNGVMKLITKGSNGSSGGASRSITTPVALESFAVESFGLGFFQYNLNNGETNHWVMKDNSGVEIDPISSDFSPRLWDGITHNAQGAIFDAQGRTINFDNTAIFNYVTQIDAAIITTYHYSFKYNGSWFGDNFYGFSDKYDGPLNKLQQWTDFNTIDQTKLNLTSIGTLDKNGVLLNETDTRGNFIPTIQTSTFFVSRTYMGDQHLIYHPIDEQRPDPLGGFIVVSVPHFYTDMDLTNDVTLIYPILTDLVLSIPSVKNAITGYSVFIPMDPITVDATPFAGTYNGHMVQPMLNENITFTLNIGLDTMITTYEPLVSPINILIILDDGVGYLKRAGFQMNFQYDDNWSNMWNLTITK